MFFFLRCGLLLSRSKPILLSFGRRLTFFPRQPIMCVVGSTNLLFVSSPPPPPPPDRTALQVESIISQNGAVPATIGIIDGNVFVGLQRTQLEQLSLKGRCMHDS